MTRALNSTDMSMWGGEFTETECEAMWAAGVRNIKVGDGWAGQGGGGMWAREQAETWLRVTGGRGGTVDSYVYLYMAEDAGTQMTNALATLEGVAIRVWWLDAEDISSPQLTPAERAKFLWDCILYLNGKTAGIYTAKWWWPDHMGNNTDFSFLPLWNSWYDNDPDESGLPYGGWEHSAVEQYADTQLIGGQSVDLNYDSTLEEDEMGMNPQEADRLALLERIVAGWGFTSDEGDAMTNGVALKYIDDHQRSLYKGLALEQEKIGELDAASRDHESRIDLLESPV